MKKIKLLTLGDHPLVPSGVGTQSRYVIEGLLRTGKYEIVSIGGAIRHHDYKPIRTEEFKEAWTIYPQDGYGNAEMIRQAIEQFKPDGIWFITDPRFYTWLFEISDEIRGRGIPLFYWAIWDELPTPIFNLPYYRSCDFIGCISKLTYRIMEDLDKRFGGGLLENCELIHHAVNEDAFKPLPASDVLKAKIEVLGPENAHKFVVFYNSRNARRKMTADVLKCFKQFMDKVGPSNAMLFMHTDPFDQEGSNLHAVADMLGLQPSNLKFSTQGLPPETIAMYYNIADVTVNISNNEGWGLSCHESLSCGTPAIVNKTGGLQDQIVSDTGQVFGACLEPATKSIQGSQQIPYIYDCRVADIDVVDALERLYKMGASKREALGADAAKWVRRAFPMKKMIQQWDSAIHRYVERYRKKDVAPQLKCAVL